MSAPLRIYASGQGIPSSGRELHRTAVRVRHFSKWQANVLVNGSYERCQISALDVIYGFDRLAKVTCISSTGDINSYLHHGSVYNGPRDNSASLPLFVDKV